MYELRCWLQHPVSLDGAVEQVSLVLVQCDFKHYFKIRLLLYKYFAQAQGVLGTENSVSMLMRFLHLK